MVTDDDEGKIPLRVRMSSRHVVNNRWLIHAFFLRMCHSDIKSVTGSSRSQRPLTRQWTYLDRRRPDWTVLIVI